MVTAIFTTSQLPALSIWRKPRLFLMETSALPVIAALTFLELNGVNKTPNNIQVTTP